MKKLLSLFVITFVLFATLSFNSNSILANETSTTITPNYIACPVWGSQHRYVDTGYYYFDEVFAYQHLHAIADGYSGTIYVTCNVYNRYKCSQQLCACGAERYIRTYLGQVHYHQ